MRKNIKNYTTSISVQKSLSQIQEMLAQAKASKIMVDYDQSGTPTALTFAITTAQGILGFRLPARVEAVAKIMYPNQYLRVGFSDSKKEQYKKTAWRNIHDWVDAQLALIATNMVTPEEVFLPYMIHQEGRTLYESFSNGKLLGSGS